MLSNHALKDNNILFRPQAQIVAELAHPQGMDAKARKALSTNVKRLMEINGWNQPALRRKTGLAQGTISYIVRGEARSVGIDAIEALADAFGVPIWALLIDFGNEVTRDELKRTDRLLQAYAKLPPVGKDTVDRVAEVEARYAQVA